MRVVFFGTPDFAVGSLDAVHRQHEVAAVVAQPDKPAGRGMKMQTPAVAVRARELGLPLLQPPKIRDPEFLESMEQLTPDAGVVVAYGKILPAALLEIPRHGFFNVHGSVLPQYRGAAPIQRAIEAGESETGVTILRVDEELDHGAILAIETTPIGPDEHTPALANRLSRLGAEALVRVLRDVEHGVAVETPQDHSRATLAPKIDKSEGEIRFDAPARAIYDKFRAFDPWPGIFFETIKVTACHVTAAPTNTGPSTHARDDIAAGTILAIDETGVVVACAPGGICILEMQRPGKPRTHAAAVARGLGWRVGHVL